MSPRRKRKKRRNESIGRNRRAAQCRQVHIVQRAYQEAAGGGRELPVLHDRAQLSTLFNALTKKQQAAAENYPFCTIEPNSAIVEVADPRLEALAKIVSPQQIIRATVEFTDIAGLVKGASKGEGLGNKFLANIRECDAILHVVRCFAGRRQQVGADRSRGRRRGD